MRPGVTGLAQIQFAADTDLTSVAHKLVYDCYYVQRATLWLDVRILVCTAVYLILEVPLRVVRELVLLLDKQLIERELAAALGQASRRNTYPDHPIIRRGRAASARGHAAQTLCRPSNVEHTG